MHRSWIFIFQWLSTDKMFFVHLISEAIKFFLHGNFLQFHQKSFFTYKCHFFPNERRLLKFSSSKGKKCNHVNDKCPRNAWIPLQNMKICHFESPKILFSSIPRQFLFAFLSSRIAMTILIKSEKQYINFGEFLIWPKGAYPKTFYVIIFWNYCQP